MTQFPKLKHANLSPSHEAIVQRARSLYQERLDYFAQTHRPPAYISSAPGRVNVIGEHVDYQNGYVLPFALADYRTVCYGTGNFNVSTSKAPTLVRLRLVSDQCDEGPDLIEERRWSGEPPKPTEDDERSWVNYVVGVIAQYTPDLPPEGCILDLAMAYSSNVPLGSGLSSSAALEVCTAAFLECFLNDGMAFSSVKDSAGRSNKILRALRCQKAENEWAFSPCGILDQYASSCCEEGSLLQIDCKSLEATSVPMKETEDPPVFLITNTGVSHSIADSSYGKRRKECHEAVNELQQVPLYHVESLRDATIQDLATAKSAGKLDDDLYKRAHHVVSENIRTKECVAALRLGVWEKVGELMTASHVSLKNDFEVSCEELDTVVDLANACPDVYGSRMTGGGFGGCTVTLVRNAEAVAAVVEAIKAGYPAAECFVSTPGKGAYIAAIDMDCKPEPTH